MRSRINTFTHVHMNDTRDKLGKLGNLNTVAVALQLQRMFDQFTLFMQNKANSETAKLT